jgi:hypothetical protein
MKTSVITFGRNDDYKEKDRFIIHLTTLLDTFDEVIYVDWNSPERSFLYEVIDNLPKTGRLKHFVITPYYHDLLTNSDPDVQKCNNVLAVNIALRRTDADWVAITTIDNIPPLKEELIDFIKNNDENTFYTFSRRDAEYEEVLKNTNNLTEYRKYLGTITEPRYFPAMVTPNDHYSLINCCGDFQLASKNVWNTIKGLEESMIYSCFVDTNVQKKAVLNNFGLKAIYDIPVYHMSHTKNMVPQGGDMTTLHENSSNRPPKYNSAWNWVEWFTESQNTEDWGLANTEIEFEVF